MKGKVIIILLLIALLSYTVYEMLRYEQSVRSERVVREYIEDEEAPLVEQPAPEILQQMAENVDYYFQANGDVFSSLQYSNENKALQWEPFLMKGLNLGVALPGKFPAEFSMSMEEYLNWMKMIGEMNANTIRVYTILPPEFYMAFARYNLMHQDKPLYLLQGVWATVPETHNYLSEDYSRMIEKEITDVIDVLHGNAVLKPQKGKADGVYSTDVSQYVAGILFGREWEPNGVTITNQKGEVHRFQGNFIGLHNGTPMEVWLAKMMDFCVLYETMTYGMQHPVSFVNWLPLDPIYHNTEFIENKEVREYDNDLETVDFMHFHASPAFFPGIFASYHAYPYYPDFVYLNPDYEQHLNSRGEIDNYAAYLKSLKAHNPGMPLVIAEYGLPSSRGNSHLTPLGLDQGGHNERSHAHLNCQLTRDIFETGCAGAVYFEWTDEWFKHNWLVMDFEIPFENRKLWHNMENPEQNFGIMALEPGKKTIDGLLNDWKTEKPLNDSKVLTASDAAYFYMTLNIDQLDFSRENLYIALDVVPGRQGDHRLPFTGEKFENGFEFLLEFLDPDSARILVDEPYSVFTDIYNDHIPGYRSKPNENGRYIEQLLLSNRGRESLTGEKFDSITFNRSPLIFGKSNLPEYSNADWYYNDSAGILEIRLTWHLINVTDPSTGCVLDDVQGTPEIECTQTNGIALQAFVTDAENRELYRIPQNELFFHEWKTWKDPVFVQRLKPLYDSLKKCFTEDIYKPIAAGITEAKVESFEICDYYHDHPGAISVRFEKGYYSQYENAQAVLDKYRKKASFYLDEEIGELQPGYSISGSGQQMKKMGADAVAELRNAVHHIATVQTPGSYVLIPASGLSADSLLKIIKHAGNEWLVFQYEEVTSQSHDKKGRGITEPDRINRAEFDKQIRLMRNSGFWVAPEIDVFEYLEERDNVELLINTYSPFHFVTAQTPLNNVDFNFPLSFYYYSNAPKIEVQGSEDDGFYQNRNGKYLLNARPGREITIKNIW